MLPKEMSSNSKLRLRFEREAKAAAKLHHSNIVPVFGVGESIGRVYFVMQYIQGAALDCVLEELRLIKSNRASHTTAVDTKPATKELSPVVMAQTLLSGSPLSHWTHPPRAH